jgi:hypothetical protein
VARWLILLVCALLVLQPLAAAFSQPVPSPANGPSVPLELGLGPSNLRSLDAGVPVYTRGDEMWIMNTYNSTANLSLQGPFGGSPEASSSLAPLSIEVLYSFPSSAPCGEWMLNISWAGLANVALPVEVASSTPGIVGGHLVSASLSGSLLSLNYSLALGLADDVTATLADASLNPVASLQIPTNLGSGTLAVQVVGGGNASTVTLQGTVSMPFAFWLELYGDYSYSQISTAGYITSELLAATSQAIEVASGFTTAQMTMEQALVLRPGRYTLRAYFQRGTNIFVAESGLVMQQNESWIWLNPSSEAPVDASSFNSTVDLSKSSWPSYLLLTYRSGGISSYSIIPLGVTLGSVSTAFPPWGNVASDVTVRLKPSPLVLSSGWSEGVLYVVGTSDGFNLPYDIAFGNHTFLSSSVYVRAGLSASIPVSLGKLVVNVILNGRPASGASIIVSDGLGGSATRATSTTGNATFYVPPGTYNVTVVDGSLTLSRSAEITSARTQMLSVPLSSSSLDLLTPLLVLAVVAGAFNVWIWVYRPLSRRRTVGPSSPAPP